MALLVFLLNMDYGIPSKCQTENINKFHTRIQNVPKNDKCSAVEIPTRLTPRYVSNRNKFVSGIKPHYIF